MNLDPSIGGEVQCILKTHVLYTLYAKKETLFISVTSFVTSERS